MSSQTRRSFAIAAWPITDSRDKNISVSLLLTLIGQAGRNEFLVTFLSYVMYTLMPSCRYLYVVPYKVEEH